jgi:ATP phosphoribosyltransferase regulatory subunit
LASQLGDARVTFDLADLRGYAYYSGPRFSVYASGAGDALVRGGRYDGVGAVFGHNHDRARPAVGKVETSWSSAPSGATKARASWSTG